jgi:hypothetical protein
MLQSRSIRRKCNGHCVEQGSVEDRDKAPFVKYQVSASFLEMW